MTRHWAIVTLICITFVAIAAVSAREEDEPTFLDKKLSHWMDLLANGKDATTRIRGAIAVEQIGHSGSRKVVPALVKALREDGDAEVRARTARSVGRACAKALKQARDDEKEELPRFDNARDALVTALRMDKTEKVREAAAAALGDLGSDARAAAGALALALKDKHSGTVIAAAGALRRFGKDAREAEPELLNLVADKKADLEARIDAAHSLGQIRADVATAMKTMREVLEDDKLDFPEKATDEEKQQAREKHSRLRRAVVEALGKWGKDAADSSVSLAAVLIKKETPEEVKLAIVTALELFGAEAKAAVPALVKAINDSDRVVRCLAMQTIGKLTEVLEDNRRSAIKAMLKATEDSNSEVALTAIETLGVLSGTGLGEEKAEVIKRLVDIIKRDGRKPLREAAQIAHDKVDSRKKDKEKDK